jgi:hypothetical protein
MIKTPKERSGQKMTPARPIVPRKPLFAGVWHGNPLPFDLSIRFDIIEKNDTIHTRRTSCIRGGRLHPIERLPNTAI